MPPHSLQTAVVRLKAFPRLHFGLIDLADATPRRFCGSGVALTGPPIEVEAEVGETISIEDGSGSLDLRARAQITEAVERFAQLRQVGSRPVNPQIRLISSPPSHVGLGTKTATILSILQACSDLYGVRVNRRTLQITSGRGGASGIGIHTFFHGGLVSDFGHSAGQGTPFLPSASAAGHTPPPLLVRMTVPAEFEFHLILPNSTKQITTVSGEAERSFFLANTPITEVDAALTAAWTYQGILASIRTRNLQTLHRSLRKIHELGFKKREVANHGLVVERVLDSLWATACPAGMSSMGPLVYAIGRRGTEDSQTIQNACAAADATVLTVERVRNKGYERVPRGGARENPTNV